MTPRSIDGINKICARCRESKLFGDFRPDKERKDGKASYCRACEKIRRKELRARTDPRVFREKAMKPKMRFHAAKNNAKTRKKSFRISYSFFIENLNSPCFYCGKSILGETGSGMDRYDNGKGYFKSNVLACCSRCNTVRGRHLTSDEARVAIQAVLEFRAANKRREDRRKHGTPNKSAQRKP